MLSTPNSPAAIPRPWRFATLWGGTFAKLFSAATLSIVVVISMPCSGSTTQTNQPTARVSGRTNEAASRADRLYTEAQQHYRAEPANIEVAWQFGRAAFDRAEAATNDSHRVAIAEKGIAACRHAIARDAKAAAAHYYLALNLGQLARTKTFGALRLVEQMEMEFKTAITLDPGFDFGGPDRSLGMLYRDAPGWPISVGSRAKASFHLQQAVNLAPDYPDNRLCLLEAYLAWGQKKAARAELKSTQDALDKARKTFTGEQWAASWEDWDKRWQRIKTNAFEPPKPLKSPRDKSS